MYAVSNAWLAAQNDLLAPEGFVELSCYIPERNDTLVYTKRDLMSFYHQQTGSLVSGTLPKNHIEFSLDNSDGTWDPNNPTGLERYLSQRLRITLRYGCDINGTVEWIPGGVFYLSDWTTSPDGLEASFVARDLLEYMMDKPYKGEVSGTLYDLATRAIAVAKIPSDVIVNISDRLKGYTVDIADYDGAESVADILQKCANAAGCVMYQDRMGVFNIVEFTYEESDMLIPKRLAYAYPRTTFTRPLLRVSVTYGNDECIFLAGSAGETQTVDNKFIQNRDQAYAIAKWVSDNMRSRMDVSGDFRGDPRLDLFDVVSVEYKYGTIVGVILTDIKCSFTGAFHTTYTGYVYGSGASVVVYSNELYTGEVS